MKFYYIDDCMLANNDFSGSVLYRFECWMKEHPADFILVSAKHKDSLELQQFLQYMEPTKVFISPMKFDVQGIRGELRDNSLSVEGFADMQSYNGSFVSYDSDSFVCERIYLDFFIGNDACDNERYMDELERMLNEKLHLLFKKKSITN